MVTLARLGSKVGMVAKVGDDEYGKFIISEFEKEGVDTSHIVVEKGGRGPIIICLVENVTGERVFLGYSKISQMQPEEINLEYIEQAKILHIDGFHFKAAERTIKIAKENGILVSFDMGMWRPEFIDIVGMTDILIPSKQAAIMATGENSPEKIVRKLKAFGPKIVAVTLGEEGSICLSDSDIIYKKAFKVPVVDTTGAGDVYHGAFLFGVLKNWDIESIVEFANATAAIKCTKLGGRAGIPNYRQVIDFLAKNLDDTKWLQK
jgi:sugar/nucleoside kinase (ribokinase family)